MILSPLHSLLLIGKAAEEARKVLRHREAAEASRAAEEQITEAGGSVITMADAAGNTPVPSEKSPEVNFRCFLVICGILVVLLLLVFFVIQINRADTENEDGKIKAEKYPETTETIPDNKLQ